MNTKTSIHELAVFGGQPCFERPLHVGGPNIGDHEKLFERLRGILDRRWLSNNGQCVQELERKLADFLGVKHCVATCNATVALEVAVRALGLSGEVIVPAFTFVATVHSLAWQGISPVFCDVDPTTHAIDSSRVEHLITAQTTGILGVHLWGRACDVATLTGIATQHNLKLLFDAAHAFGCSTGGEMIGRFGNAEVFSFHATKFFNSFEGGAITTNDDKLATRLRMLRNFGFGDVDAVECIGINGKMTEVCAAMGLTNFESLSTFMRINRQNHDLYSRLLANIHGFRVLPYDLREHCNFQYVVIEVDESLAGISRDELVRMLSAENVMARRYFFPGCHRMQPYRSSANTSRLVLPNTERLCRQVMALPTGTAIGAVEIAAICGMIELVVKQSEDFKHRMVASSRLNLATAA